MTKVRKKMPRIPKNQVEEREAYMAGLFKNDPNLSMPKANELFAAKFGSKMRAQRVYALRSQVREANDGVSNAPAADSNTLKMSMAGTVPTPKNKAALLRVPEGSEQLAVDIYTALVKEGIATGGITHRGSGYVVVET